MYTHVCINETVSVFLPNSVVSFYRHILAAVHFNFNLQRDVRHRKGDDADQIKVTYPKFKNGEAIVRDVRVAQNFGKSLCVYLYM